MNGERGGSLPDSTVVEKTDTALATTIDGEAVILERGTGTYYSLNTVATDIWNYLEKPQTVADIHEKILTKYDINSKRCERDLTAVLTEMEGYGLIEIGVKR